VTPSPSNQLHQLPSENKVHTDHHSFHLQSSTKLQDRTARGPNGVEGLAYIQLYHLQRPDNTVARAQAKAVGSLLLFINTSDHLDASTYRGD
jgi:hypothetical protein